jgi:hypothetical protein
MKQDRINRIAALQLIEEAVQSLTRARLELEQARDLLQEQHAKLLRAR